jgi:leucyl-tRNA synthetase
VQFCHRFLNGLWQYAQSCFALDPEPLDEQGAYRTEFMRRRLQKWCEIAIEKITEDLAELEMHTAVRNVIRLLERIRLFETRTLKVLGAQGTEQLGRQNHAALVEALGLLARVLMPFAPHVGEELWLASGLGTAGVDPPWPLVKGNSAAPSGDLELLKSARSH